MEKALIVFFIFFIIAGGGIYLYLNYEKPITMNQEVNLSIYATNNVGQYIITRYKVYFNNKVIKTGKTLSQGAILFNTFRNSSLYVENYNLQNQNYYPFKWVEKRNENISRVNLKLIKPSRLIVKHLKGLNFSLTTKNQFRNLTVCASWSDDFVYVRGKNLLKDSFGNYYKCWIDGRTFIKGKIYYFDLKYKAWGKLQNTDYVSLEFMDDQNNNTDLYATNTKIKIYKKGGL